MSALRKMLGRRVIRVTGMEPGSDEIVIGCEAVTVRLHHRQDCCESVCVEDVTGDPEDLVGEALLIAEERSSTRQITHGDSSTWTFYEFATIKGSVTVRWLGQSNGFYSEEVDINIVERFGVKEDE